MGATYTRQSTISDGAVIEASHFNDEFDQILAAFASSTGHTHDGTSAEGGPIAKLLSNTLTFGAGTAGTDITMTFDGETSDGVLYWMEDEDHFKFADDVVIDSSKKLYLYDEGGEYISGDGTDLTVTSGGDVTLDAGDDIVLDADGGDIFFKDGGTTFGSATNTSGNLILKSGTTTAVTFSGANATVAGNLSVGGDFDVTGSLDFSDAAITNVGSIQLDSIAGDGDTNTSITFSGSDVITIAAGGDNQITFNNGSILPVTDNDIDLGSSSYEFKDGYFDGTLYADAINFNGTAISATAAELNIMDGVTATASELNALDGINSTVTELNIVDGNTSASTVTIVDADQIILNDNGTMKQVAVSALNTYTSSSIAADDISTGDAAVTLATSSGNITIDAQAGDADIIFKGTDSSSDITALTLDMSAAGAATFNDKVIATELDISGDMDIDGTSNLDNTDIDGTLAVDGTTISLDATTSLNIDNSNTSNGITIGTATSGVPISIGHSTSEVTINDNLTITGNFTVNGTTTTVNSTTTTVDDPVFTLGGDSAPGSDDNKDRGIEFRYHDGSSARIGFFGYDDSATGFTFLTAASNSSEVFSGTEAKIIAGELDISGDVDVDGTLETDALSINGTAVSSTAAELNILDGVTSTAAELNIVDGDTSASSVTLADADRVVVNDGGTMKQVAVTAMTTYIESNASFATKGFATAMSIAL